VRSRAAKKVRGGHPPQATQPSGPIVGDTTTTADVDDRAVDNAKRRRALVRKMASCVMVAVFALALFQALQFKGLGQWFPLLASSLGLAISVIYAALLLAGKEFGTSAYDIGNEDLDGAGLKDNDIPQWWVLVGLALFPALVALLGLIPALVLWMPAFLLRVAGLRWWYAALGTAGCIGVLYVLQLYIGMVFPGSVFVS
jgi:hypothetical protein